MSWNCTTCGIEMSVGRSHDCIEVMSARIKQLQKEKASRNRTAKSCGMCVETNQCGEHAAYKTWTCTREAEHDGPHVVCNIFTGYHKLKTWPSQKFTLGPKTELLLVEGYMKTPGIPSVAREVSRLIAEELRREASKFEHHTIRYQVLIEHAAKIQRGDWGKA